MLGTLLTYVIVHFRLGPLSSELQHCVLLVLVRFHFPADLARDTSFRNPLSVRFVSIGRLWGGGGGV